MSEENEVQALKPRAFPELPIVNLPGPSFLTKHGFEVAWIWFAFCVLFFAIAVAVVSGMEKPQLNSFGAGLLVATIIVNAVVVAAITTVQRQRRNKVERLLRDKIRDRDTAIDKLQSMYTECHGNLIEAWTQRQEYERLFLQGVESTGQLTRDCDALYDYLMWIVAGDRAEFVEWFSEHRSGWEVEPLIADRETTKYILLLDDARAQWRRDRAGWRGGRSARDSRWREERGLSHKALMALMELVMICAVEATKIEGTPDDMKAKMDELVLAIWDILGKLIPTHRQLHGDDMTRSDGDKWVLDDRSCGLLFVLGAKHSRPHELQKLLNLLREHQSEKFLEVLRSLPDDIQLLITNLMIHAPDEW